MFMLHLPLQGFAAIIFGYVTCLIKIIFTQDIFIYTYGGWIDSHMNRDSILYQFESIHKFQKVF